MSYRHVYYDSRAKSIHHWGWDKDGNRTYTKKPFKPYLYVESHNGKDATSIYNTNLRKVEFRNGYERRRFADGGGINRLFYNIAPDQQYLIDEYAGTNNSAEFTKRDLKIAMIDIEVYSPNEFPAAEYANHPVNVITVYNSLEERYYTWGLVNDYNNTREDVTYMKCETETILLKQFLRHWSAQGYDILSGWNSHGFDTPYLINRMNKLLGEDAAKDLSPIGQMWFRDGIPTVFGKEMGQWRIYGLSNLDYMDVYKKFSRGMLESYALDFVAEHELGEGKLRYNATDLAKLSQTDWQTFIDYNLRDVTILVRLEEKLQFFKLVRAIAYRGLTNLESAMGTISIVTGAMAQEAKAQNMIIPTFKHHQKADYAGGYVRDPKRGISRAVVSFDANSLYPNTIITLNLSPETKIGKVLSKNKDGISVQLVSGETYNLSPEKFAAFVNREQLSVSKAKILYSQKKKGFCPALIESLYQDRVNIQKKLRQYKRKLVALQKTNDTEEDLAALIQEINLLDINQYARKILLNSIYGTFANKHSPFYDIDAASSITLTGQATVKQSSKIVQQFTTDKYGISSDLTIYSDTDSIYFTIEPILKKLNIELLDDTGNVSAEAHKIVEAAGVYLNDAIAKWAKDSLNSNDSRFVFKREAICDTGIFIQKKRYILHILDDEGIQVDKMKFVGVELARSIFSKPVKQLIKNVVVAIVKSGDIDRVNEIYRESFEEFKKLSIDEISFRSSISNYNKYAELADGFRIAKRTPIHVKGSIYYNTLLKNMKLDNKYESITSGNKIKWFYCSPNPYDLKCLSYSADLPKEFGITPNNMLMFDKTVRPAVDRLYDCIGWPIQNFNINYANNLLALFS